MKRLDYAISRIPVFLFLTIAAFNLTVTFVEFDQSLYEKIYFVASETIGNSLATGVFFLLACFRYKLCWYNKVSVFGLLALNLVNYLAISPIPFYDAYYTTITHVVMIPTAVLAIILLIKGV